MNLNNWKYTNRTTHTSKHMMNENFFTTYIG
jgi:hypothetical protein